MLNTSLKINKKKRFLMSSFKKLVQLNGFKRNFCKYRKLSLNEKFGFIDILEAKCESYTRQDLCCLDLNFSAAVSAGSESATYNRENRVHRINENRVS